MRRAISFCTPTRSWTDARWAIVEGASPKVTLRHDRLAWPLLARSGRRILLGGDADLFDEQIPPEFVASVFGVMAQARQHTFQLLTRHPQRLALFLAWLDRRGAERPPGSGQASLCEAALSRCGIHLPRFVTPWPASWPLPNVWLGLRAGPQDLRTKVPRLLMAPASLRWLYLDRPSAPVDLRQLKLRVDDVFSGAGSLPGGDGGHDGSLNALTGCIRHAEGAMVSTVGRLDWVVVDSRDDAAVARSISQHCATARVPVYCFGEEQGRLPRDLPCRSEPRAVAERRTPPRIALHSRGAWAT